MINRKFLIFPLLAVSIGFVRAASVDLRTTSTATINEGAMIAKVTLARNLNRMCPSAASWVWGEEQACPVVRISSIEVKLDGKKVFVPYSAFGDLGNPRKVTADWDKKLGSYFLKIEGGEAATSYIATLTIRLSTLTEREVKSGEFPDEAWERTTYKFNN